MDGAGFTMARVAVLVDGDNVSAASMDEVLRVARMAGDPAVRRVYAKPDRLRSWEEGGFLAFPVGAIKNAADMALTVGALQLAYEHLAEDFVIVASDRDYTVLVHQLRLMKHRVTLVCGPQAPAGLRAICSQVHDLPKLAPEEPAGVVHAKLRPTLSPLDAAIHGTVQHLGTSNAMLLSILANHANLRGFAGRPKSGKWRTYFTDSNLYRCDKKGAAAKVHLVGA